MIVVCFAILQALQPFIHTHLDAEHPIQHHGFHIGNDLEESENGHDNHAVSDVSHIAHTISAASGIKPDIDTGLLSPALLAVALSICLFFVLRPTHLLNSAFLLIPNASLKRRLPAPRAPPQD